MVLTRAAAVICGLALSALACASARADESEAPSFVLTHCRVVTVVGDTLDDGVVIVRKGRIDAVFARGETPYPEGLPVVDGQGGTLWPAFVHPASRIGLRGGGDGNDNSMSPDATVDNDLNPWLAPNRYAAASGFATLGLLPGPGIVGGRGMAVRTAAASVESMTRKKDVYLRLDVDTGPRFHSTVAKALATARGELDAQAKYAKDLADWEEQKAKAEAEKKPVPKKPDEPKPSPANEAWRKALLGDIALLAFLNDSAEVHALIDALSDERVRGQKLRLYTFVAGDTYQDAAGLADLGATCIVRAGIATWAGSTDEFCPAVQFLRAGCDVVLAPGGDDRDGLRAYRHLLGRTLRAGFPADRLVRAATLDAAAVLGLAEDTGAIAKGRRADLVLYSGDPLGATTDVRAVFIDGERIEETQ